MHLRLQKVGVNKVRQFLYQPTRFYDGLRKTHGAMAALDMLGKKLYMVLTAEGAKQVLTVPSREYGVFQKKAFGNLAGSNSLFVLEAQAHHLERRVLMPAFHTSFVSNYSDQIFQIVRGHTQSFKPGLKLLATNFGLDISRDVILSIVYGKDFERIKAEGRVIVRNMLSTAHPILEYMEATHRPWFPPWLRFRRAKSAFDSFAMATITQRRTDAQSHHDVLERLIESKNAVGDQKSDQEILDELYTILLPGHATTGVAISWALYELLKEPQHLERLRAEVDALGVEAHPAAFNNLPFLKAVCDESMRLHTIVTEHGRLNLRGREILGYQIPADVGLVISINAVHHDPAVYPNPHQFDPDRFLENQFSSFEFMPFGGGHRRCLGAALSDFEMRVVVGMLVRDWDMELLIKEERESRHNLGMGPKYRVPIRVKGPRWPPPVNSS